MKTTFRLARFVCALSFCSLLASCGGSDGSGGGVDSPAVPTLAIQSFSPVASAVYVGESTQLTPVFSGGTGSIAGIGAVQSGVPVSTPALAITTTFTLTVSSGSQQVQAYASVHATYRDRIRMLAPSPVAYTQHVAVPLADGSALVMGGNTSESPNVPDADSSRRFDAVTETLVPGPQLALSAEADLTTAVLLDNGGFLLVVPGINTALHIDSGLRATQAFDPTTRTFHRVGNFNVRHDAGGAATALYGGGAFVSGGQVPAVAVAERYDPQTEQWTPAGSMTTARRGHTATRLFDGRVLIVGGVTCCDQRGEVITNTAEIYDPVSGMFGPTGSMSTARGFHTATLLLDGRVLVTGGFRASDNSATASAEIYDPSTARFTPAGDMQAARSVHSATILTDGRVLVVGGVQLSEVTDIFDPQTNTWRPGPTPAPARAATATLLRNGKVLIFGGEGASGFPIPTAMLFE
ncbi:MAG TPA: kelch repeat-containing protein [Povalibacter sp.]|nr:kelch repeat-containing protein [Povalibacter sp.]